MTWVFENFQLELERGVLTREGRDVPLRPQSFDVLVYLVQNHGRLVSKDELLSEVWSGRIVGDDSITQCLTEIRAALDDADRTKIKTLPRRGFIFELPVRRAGDGGAGNGPGRVAGARMTRLRVALAAALVLAALALGLYWAGDRGQPQSPSEPEWKPDTDQSKTLAVLPFVDMSPGNDQGHFADGMTEELILQLSQVEGLMVTGRTSAFQFKGRGEDLTRVGRSLGVEHVLEGSIRTWDDQVRVTAQLVRADNGFHLWSEAYDRPLDDLFAIQDEITGEVVSALRVTLGVGGNGNRHATTSVEAYSLVAAAEQLVRDDQDQSQVLESLELYRRATEVDPEYAYAWASLAQVYAYFKDEVSADWMRLAREALERAEALEPDAEWLAYPQVFYYVNVGDWQSAERIMQGREVTAGSFNIAFAALEMFMKTGHPKRALDLAQRGVRRDPLNAFSRLFLQHAYAVSGRVDEALEQSEWLHENAVGVDYLNECLMAALSQADESVVRQWLQRRLVVPSEAGVHEAMYERLDDREAALRWLRAFESDVPNFYYNAQVWAAYLGDAELALALMREFPDPWSMWMPFNAGVRQLPGFRDVLQDLGLVDYWREFGWGEFCQPLGQGDFTCR